MAKIVTTGTVTEYARYRGCNHSSVSQAIRDGRLHRSLTRVGKRWCIDFERADREWAANTEPRMPMDRAVDLNTKMKRSQTNE